MKGGLMQLVAWGAQDVCLTSDPQTTFLNVVYRRHTSFDLESIENTFNGDIAHAISNKICRVNLFDGVNYDDEELDNTNDDNMITTDSFGGQN